MNKKEIISVVIILVLFILFSYLGSKYDNEIQLLLLGHEKIGLFVYFFLTIFSIIVAPLNMLPLIPVAVTLWGPFVTTMVNIIGWTLGGFIAFYLSRIYGRPLISKFIDPKRLDKIEVKIPEKNLLLVLIGIRMILPVDILSYALGLFTSISYRIYLLSTVIGVIPFAFVFSYVSVLSFGNQIIISILALCIFVFSLRQFKKYVKVN